MKIPANFIETKKKIYISRRHKSHKRRVLCPSKISYKLGTICTQSTHILSSKKEN